jgi:hypothetical protein
LRFGRLLPGQLGFGDAPFRLRGPLPAKQKQRSTGEEHESYDKDSAKLRTIHDTSRH